MRVYGCRSLPERSNRQVDSSAVAEGVAVIETATGAATILASNPLRGAARLRAVRVGGPFSSAPALRKTPNIGRNCSRTDCTPRAFRPTLALSGDGTADCARFPDIRLTCSNCCQQASIALFSFLTALRVEVKHVRQPSFSRRCYVRPFLLIQPNWRAWRTAGGGLVRSMIKPRGASR